MKTNNSYNANIYTVTCRSAYDVPDGKNSSDYLKELCQSGLKERYGSVTAETENRLNHELNIIKDMGLADCFLVAWDIICFAKSRGITVGPGRGSMAGSIVFYVLGITDIEPIRYSLMFERFINPECSEMPDITIDIIPDGLYEIKEYAVQKYRAEQGAELFKISFVALRELAVIKNTVEAVKRNKGIDVDIENIDYNKKEVYELISSGNTGSVFLLEDEAMREFMQNLNPYSLEEITAGIALCRPGAIAQVPAYIEGKNNPEAISHKRPLLKQILGVTYGCLLYQEQLMEMAQKLAGYSLGKADIMRQSIVKRKSEQMETERKNFIYGSDNGDIPGCIKNGIDEETAISIFDAISNLSCCPFNKSHAVSYAHLVYQTAYLKTFYPDEYMEALNSSID